MEPNDTSNSSGNSSDGSGKNSDKFLPISILVAAVLIGGALVFAALNKGGSVANTGGATTPTQQP
jgi:hypothetical protein